jgi:transposase
MRGMTELVKRAYRYRFYPTPEQVEQLNRTFGCVRPVYNKALEARARAWATERRRLTYGQTSAISVRNLVRNRRPARAIADAAWWRLGAMLEYRTRWHGRDLVVIDRWFPSSKRCSACGWRVESMPLAVREWNCPCGRSTTGTSTPPATSWPPGWRTATHVEGR